LGRLFLRTEALTGAEFRIWREGRDELGEPMAPEEPDEKTMGLSLLIQARETLSPVPFVPPAWAHIYKDDSELADRPHRIGESNFWWIELGGDQDSIHDSDLMRTGRNMRHTYRLDDPPLRPPAALVRSFVLEAEQEGTFHTVADVPNNYQRLVRLPLRGEMSAVRLRLRETWGAERVNVFAFDVR
jgi:hypothetical protein